MPILKYILIQLLTWEARLILKKYHPYVIAVTGNMGKTSTKDAIYAVLSDGVSVRRSEKSLNSDTGVPLTIIGAQSGWQDPKAWLKILYKGVRLILTRAPYPQTLILEVGADHPGDIQRIASWVRPHCAVITGIPDIPVHIAYFDSADALAREKRELARSVREGGSVVVNGDDHRARAIGAEFRALSRTYGMQEGNTVHASHSEIAYEDGVPVGMRFRINHKGSSVPALIRGALGETHILPALAACAIADVLGVDAATAAQRLAAYMPPPGRMRVIAGKGGATLIDDSYNSSPAALRAALTTLRTVEAKRRIALLGDMRELGKESARAHKELGAFAATVVDMLSTVGEESEVLAHAAREQGMEKEMVREYGYGESEKAAEALLPHLAPGDVVLVKGSQNMIRMEKAVKVLMAHPEQAGDLLVRQEAEWQRR